MADKGGKQEKKQTQKKRHAMTAEQRKLYDQRRSQRLAQRQAKWNKPEAVAKRTRRRLAREARAVAKFEAARARHDAERREAQVQADLVIANQILAKAAAEEKVKLAAEAAELAAAELKAKYSARAKKGAATKAAKKAAAATQAESVQVASS